MKLLATLSFMAFANTYKVGTLDSQRSSLDLSKINGHMFWWLVPFHWTWPSYWVCSVESESVQEEKRLCRVRARFHCLVISISDLPILQHLVQIIDQWANMALLCTVISSKSKHVLSCQPRVTLTPCFV